MLRGGIDFSGVVTDGLRVLTRGVAVCDQAQSSWRIGTAARQLAAISVLCNRQPMAGLQMLFEHLAPIPAFDADDVVGRTERRTDTAGIRGGSSTASFPRPLSVEWVGIYQVRNLVRCNRVVPHVSRHDLGR